LAAYSFIFLQISRIYKVNKTISQLLHKLCVPPVATKFCISLTLYHVMILGKRPK